MNDSRRIAVMLSVIACFVSASALAADGNLSGYARVADRDTIEINAQRIRLEGI
jgi:endonuclease YncB( thermonuclease family)